MTTATAFTAIVGQKRPIEHLQALIRKKTLPHALLFTGDDGVGKQTTAMAFAMACNCRTLKSALDRHLPPNAADACGECAPCRKISRVGQHPDIIHVAPASSVIRIDQIRALLEQLAFKPNEADRRVVIIANAHTMNPEAGNALLKVLEEPPDRTIIVLTARQTSDLLPTIVSRCRQIHFSPLGAGEIERLLTMEKAMDAQSAKTVAGLCGGSYTRALKWVDPKWIHRRQWIVESLGRMIADKQGPVLPWLLFAEMLSTKKDLVEESLEIITMWLRDLLTARYAPKLVLNQDCVEALCKATQTVAPKTVLAHIDAVDRARVSLKSNTNPRLTLDAMVLKMSSANTRYV